MKTPLIVSPQEWVAAREELLVEEKRLTRARDALAAKRRRMPWMAVEKEYRFDGSEGPLSLLDLFEGRRQLIVYRAFYAPDVTTYPKEGGAYPERACVGCSFGADQVAHPAHLNARDTALAFVSRAPQPEIQSLKERMGWELIPWYTITDDFDKDFGVDEWHGTNAFIRDGERIYRTYFVDSRGDEAMEAPGVILISRRSAARRSGRTRRRAIRRPHRTGGGITTTRTATPRNRRRGSLPLRWPTATHCLSRARSNGREVRRSDVQRFGTRQGPHRRRPSARLLLVMRLFAAFSAHVGAGSERHMPGRKCPGGRLAWFLSCWDPRPDRASSRARCRPGLGLVPGMELTIMKIALLGTGFGQAHAAVYAARADVDEVVVFGRTPQKLAQVREMFGFVTTSDLDAVLTDASVDLVDICLPTHLHADIAVRAMEAGNDVLIELPLADTLDDAHRVVAAQHATGRRAFVDMFSRFSPVNQYLHQVVADQRYGPLQVLELESHTALLWEGYDLGLQTLALDMMHASFDLTASLLGTPDTIQVTGIEGASGRGSAAEVILGYPRAIARCTGSSLMPNPYGMRGGSRATFADAVLEFTIHAGFTGQGPSSLTAYTTQSEHPIDLPDTSPYAAMIDHVLACLTEQADNLIEPSSALGALELTLNVQHRLTNPAV